MIHRGEVWWADVGEPVGSAPGFRRPVVIIQAESFNRSRLRTVIVVTLTSNLGWLDAPGNVLIPAHRSGLPLDSVANVTQIATIDRDLLLERAGRLDDAATLSKLANGLRLVLAL